MKENPIIIFDSPEEVFTGNIHLTEVKSGQFDDYHLKYNCARIRITAEIKVCLSKSFIKHKIGRGIIKIKKLFGYKPQLKCGEIDYPLAYCLVQIGSYGIGGFTADGSEYREIDHHMAGIYNFFRPPIIRRFKSPDLKEAKTLQIKIFLAISNSFYTAFLRNVKIELLPVGIIETPLKVIKLYAQESSNPLIMETFGGCWPKIYSFLSPIPLRPADEGNDYCVAVAKSKISTLVIEKKFTLIHHGATLWEGLRLMVKVGFWSSKKGDITYLDRIDFKAARTSIVGVGHFGKYLPIWFFTEIHGPVFQKEKTDSNMEIIKYYNMQRPLVNDAVQRGELLEIVIQVYGHVDKGEGNFKLYFTRGSEDCIVIGQCWGLPCPHCEK